ncbi:hypothetical protein [Segatella copri]
MAEFLGKKLPASSLSLFLGIAYLLRNMYLCSLIQDSNNDYEYAK